MDELISSLITLLSNQFTTTFRSYEYGKVVIPANSELPLISVEPVNTVVNNSGTVRDQSLFTVRVTVHASLKQFLNNDSGSGTVRSALQQLVQWVEDRNTTTRAVKDSTIVAVIRQNITLTGTVLYNNELTINYDDYLTNDEFPAVKAEITFTAEVRSNRI